MQDKFKLVKNIIDVNPSLIQGVWEKILMIEVFHDEEFHEFVFDEEKFYELLDLIKEEIKTRPSKIHRAEYWECINVHGEFSSKIYERLIKSREDFERVEKKINQRAVDELCKTFSLPMYMGKLFLNELKLSNSSEDERAKQYAKVLGLL